MAAAADDDPTLLDLESVPSRLCYADAVEWCHAPSCRRARCRKCLGANSQGPSNGPRSDAYIGSVTAKCNFCAIQLCKGRNGCAENNLRHCDGCNRGVCLDCEHIVSNDVLGTVRTCKGKSGKCGKFVCWRCARTVGRSKPNVGSTCQEGEGEKKNVNGVSPRRSSSNGGNGNDKFGALSFASEEQFGDATGQTLCEGCAKERVGTLNLYQRLDMSPRRM